MSKIKTAREKQVFKRPALQNEGQLRKCQHLTINICDGDTAPGESPLTRIQLQFYFTFPFLTSLNVPLKQNFPKPPLYNPMTSPQKNCKAANHQGI